MIFIQYLTVLVGSACCFQTPLNVVIITNTNESITYLAHNANEATIKTIILIFLFYFQKMLKHPEWTGPQLVKNADA